MLPRDRPIGDREIREPVAAFCESLASPFAPEPETALDQRDLHGRFVGKMLVDGRCLDAQL